MKAQPETVIHIQIVEWLRQLHPDIPFIHVANERKTSPIHGLLLKRMGVRKGVSDLFLPKGNEHDKGLWLEIKTEKGKATEPQIEFIMEMQKLGYAGVIVHGFDQAIAIIQQFYGISS